MPFRLPDFPFARSPAWTAVDLGLTGTLAAVTVRAAASGTARPRVLAATLLPAADWTADALASLVPPRGRHSRQRLVAVLRRGDYSLFTLQRPEVPAQEVERALRWTVGSQVDFPIETASIDTLTLPVQAGQLPRLYAIVAAEAVLDPVVTLFGQASLRLQAIDIRETAQRNIALRLARAGECLCLLRLTQLGVQLTFTLDGTLLLDRFIAMGFPAGSTDEAGEADRAAERMAQQTLLSVQEVQRSYDGVRVARVVVAPHADSPALVQLLGRFLDLPLEALDLADVFDLNATPQLQAPAAQATAFVALGAALRGMKDSPHA